MLSRNRAIQPIVIFYVNDRQGYLAFVTRHWSLDILFIPACIPAVQTVFLLPLKHCKYANECSWLPAYWQPAGTKESLRGLLGGQNVFRETSAYSPATAPAALGDPAAGRY